MIRPALFAAAVACTSTTTLAQPEFEDRVQEQLRVTEAFRDAVAPLVGTWKMTWQSDDLEELTAFRVYSWDPTTGIVLKRTRDQLGGGPWRHRGLTVLTPGESADNFSAHHFFGDGTSRVDATEVSQSEAGNLLLTSIISLGETQVRVQQEIADESTMIERSWIRFREWPWNATRESRWERVSETKPDTELAAPNAASESDKTITHTATVNATPTEVWRMWTTSEGMAEWWVESVIELKIGGRFELYMLPDQPEFAGNRGTEGCIVLAYLPERMLAATWNAPLSFPEQRNQHTRIVLTLEPVEDATKTRITLVHAGFPASGWTEEGSRWPEVYTYFDRAWAWVLSHLGQHFAGE